MTEYRIPGRLGYISRNGRYGLLVGDLWEHEGFHCGASVDLWDEDTEKWIPTRIEMDAANEWYLAGTPYHGTQLEGLHVSIFRSCSETGLELSQFEIADR